MQKAHNGLQYHLVSLCAWNVVAGTELLVFTSASFGQVSVNTLKHHCKAVTKIVNSSVTMDSWSDKQVFDSEGHEVFYLINNLNRSK